MILANFIRGLFIQDQQAEDGSWKGPGAQIPNDFQPFNITSVTAKTSSYYSVSLLVGTGNTEPTYNDIKLANDVSTDLSFISGTTSRADSGNHLFHSITANYKNNTSDPITIKEIGFSSSNILYTRSVLSSSVTINPGDTYAFTYNIEV